jgi:hypothetical protein
MQPTPTTSRLINTGSCPTFRGALQLAIARWLLSDLAHFHFFTADHLKVFDFFSLTPPTVE